MKNILLALLVAALFYAGSALAAVNINTANVEQLQSLPNIGAVKAEAIVKERKANGPFESVEDLTRVKGIGDKTVEKIGSDATVEDDTTSSDQKTDNSEKSTD